MMKLMFDCDDTLYDLSDPFKRTVNDLIPELIDRIDLEIAYKEYRKFGDEIFDKLQDNLISVDDSGIYRITRLCQEYGINVNDDLARAFQNKYKYYQSIIKLDLGFEDILSSHDDKIAILTNGEHVHQLNKLKALGVFDLVDHDHIFTSGGINLAKPDPRAFLYCIDKMNDKADDWYYIGDNYINDMQGAKAAGLHTIYFNRHHNPSGEAVDHEVVDVAGLKELLRKLKQV